MEQTDFLAQYVFTGLKNVNDGFDDAAVQYFSEADFETVLQRAAHFGLGIYTIKPRLGDEFKPVVSHESMNKKATDANWYKKALKTFKHQNPEMCYSATYKVSAKLLAREKIEAVPE